ncbi:unnamed protein product [Vitrella brassicaformis CCMP3155]|uniref:Uncharacterized protein n=1 Tax=Vitrella brassicaformis (strain CCMP3155) TaxID=1169540 RepID=A0A0G4F8U4_VITBC|nr:unnamed protein product [Vitrella brassicaformis CCMP3155]|eukprot:CEM08987.1 unnamed protein product [Vitrella brassicaformis CCMP3155]
MRGTKPCATGGGGYSTVFGFINQSEQSRFCEVFGRLLALHEQFVVMQTQMGDLVRFLAAKRRLAMMEAAVSDVSDALDPLKDRLRRLNGVALLEGHSQTFALVTPGDGEAHAVAEKPIKTTDTEKKVEVDAKRRHIGAADPPFLAGLPLLPTDVVRDTLMPLISGERDTPSTLKPQNTIALCRTSEAVSSALEAALVGDIDSLIEKNGLTGVIGYAPLRRSVGARHLVRRLRLIRLHYLMATGGDWRGSEPVLRLARSCGRLQQLPIELTGGDLQQAGSKTVYLRRPEAIRQYGLYGHRLGDDMQLTLAADGREILGGWYAVGVHTRWTVPARYAAGFDPKDPPCICDGDEYGTFRGLVVKRTCFGSSRRVRDEVWGRRTAEYRRICALIAQQPPLWGCRIIDYTSRFGSPYRFVILCGDKDGDEFTSTITVAKWGRQPAYIALQTSEEPQSGSDLASSVPRAVDIAHDKLGGAITLLPGLVGSHAGPPPPNSFATASSLPPPDALLASDVPQEVDEPGRGGLIPQCLKTLIQCNASPHDPDFATKVYRNTLQLLRSDPPAHGGQMAGKGQGIIWAFRHPTGELIDRLNLCTMDGQQQLYVLAKEFTAVMLRDQAMPKEFRGMAVVMVRDGMRNRRGSAYYTYVPIRIGAMSSQYAFAMHVIREFYDRIHQAPLLAQALHGIILGRGKQRGDLDGYALLNDDRTGKLRDLFQDPRYRKLATTHFPALPPGIHPPPPRHPDHTPTAAQGPPPQTQQQQQLQQQQQQQHAAPVHA